MRPAQERILGIDPGTAATGFAILDRVGTRLTPVWYDCLRTSARESDSERLLHIGRAVRDIVERFEPQAVAIEGLFFGADPRVALTVGQARGVCMLVCAEAGLEANEYAPTMIKQAVTGYGRADKQQVQRMVQATLGMTQPPTPDHCADAFAVAICHAGAMPSALRGTKPRGQHSY